MAHQNVYPLTLAWGQPPQGGDFTVFIATPNREAILSFVLTDEELRSLHAATSKAISGLIVPGTVPLRFEPNGKN